ncbi:hypothetical protein Ddye_022790 [Dipteronia dyeriana]|uniref:Transposase n=1 Tax=Dipteronia dyeriana TaxID=168575 RepID=A0AAD9WSQ1_9ROSI|nr:hypothetical protein Ddye_022790 [Dipteronia dyeriana]
MVYEADLQGREKVEDYSRNPIEYLDEILALFEDKGEEDNHVKEICNEDASLETNGLKSEHGYLMKKVEALRKERDEAIKRAEDLARLVEEQEEKFTRTSRKMQWKIEQEDKEINAINEELSGKEVALKVAKVKEYDSLVELERAERTIETLTKNLSIDEETPQLHNSTTPQLHTIERAANHPRARIKKNQGTLEHLNALRRNFPDFHSSSDISFDRCSPLTSHRGAAHLSFSRPLLTSHRFSPLFQLTAARLHSSPVISASHLRRRAVRLRSGHLHRLTFCSSLIWFAFFKLIASHCLFDPTQKVLEKQPRLSGFESSLGVSKFDQLKCKRALAKMLILDELPFRFVENRGFRRFCFELCPLFDLLSRRTIVRELYQLYIDEKIKLKKYFNRSKVRVCLTTDTWTSIQNINYMVVTAHFIDYDWQLQKRILSFSQIVDHKGDLIGKCIENVLIEWGIDKVFTITVDNATANTTAIGYVIRKLNSWQDDGEVLGGKYLHVRCCAHILNLIVGDGLKDLHDSIVAIRNAVKFVKSSPSRLERFKKAVAHENIGTKGLVVLDVPTRWNSTYLMLESAVKLRKAFERLGEEDIQYVNYFRDDENDHKRIGPPNFDDWDNAKFRFDSIFGVEESESMISKLKGVLLDLYEWDNRFYRSSGGGAKKTDDVFSFGVGGGPNDDLQISRLKAIDQEDSLWGMKQQEEDINKGKKYESGVTNVSMEDKNKEG